MNKLLKRQIEKYLGKKPAISKEVESLLVAVNDAYDGFDGDRALMERSLDLSSKEFRDLTAHLKESQETTRALLDASLYPALLISCDGTILELNKSAQDTLRTPEDEAIGTNIYDYFPQDLGRSRKARIDEAVGSVSPIRFEDCADGTIYDNVVVPISNVRGTVERVAIIAIDITERKKAELAIQESEEKYRGLVEGLQEAIYRMSLPEGNYTYVGRAVEQVMGYASKQFMDEALFIKKIAHPDFNDYFDQAWQRLIKGDVDPTYEYKIVDPDGNERWILQSNRGIFDTNGKIIAIEGLCRNITERKKAEENLIRYKSMVESAHDAIFFKDLESRYVIANKVTLEVFGLPGEEVVGKNDYELLQDQEEASENIEDDQYVFKTGNSKDITKKMTGANGVEYWFQAKKVPQFDNKGNIVGVVGIARDITERKKAEEEVRSAKSFLDAVVDLSPFAMWISDAEGTLMRSNKSLKEVLNVSDEQIVGRYNVLKDENLSKQGIMPMVKAVFEKRKPARFSIPWKPADAGEGDFKGARDLFIDVSMFPILDAKDKLTNVVCQWVDITDRKKAEEELRQSEARFKHVAEAAEEWIWEVDADGLYAYSSEAVFRILGYTPEEIVGKKHFYDLFVPDERGLLKKAAFEIFARKESFKRFENINIHKDGRAVILETSGSPIVDDAGNFMGYRGADTDITERKNAEQKLRESESALKKAQEVAHIGSWELDIVNDRLKWSEEIYRIFGVPPGTEMTAGSFLERVHPDDRDYVLAQWRAAIDGGPYDIEHRVVADGELKWVNEKAIIDFDDQGNAVRGVGTVQDVTESRRAEEELRKYRDHLEDMVKEKIQELHERIVELERYKDATVEREIRMKELRDRIAELETQNSE